MFWTIVILLSLAFVVYTTFQWLAQSLEDWVEAHQDRKFDRHAQQAIDLTK